MFQPLTDSYRYDGVLGPWIAGLIETLNTLHPLPSGLDVLPQNQLPPPRVSIQAVSCNEGLAGEILPQEPETEYHEAFLKENRRITAQDWYQDVRHLEFGFDHPIQLVSRYTIEANADDIVLGTDQGMLLSCILVLKKTMFMPCSKDLIGSALLTKD